jgi:hypothetical protein
MKRFLILILSLLLVGTFLGFINSASQSSQEVTGYLVKKTNVSQAEFSSCIVKGEEIKIKVNVSWGECNYGDVWLTSDIGNGLENHSIYLKEEPGYEITFNSSLINKKKLEIQVFAKDCFNFIYNNSKQEIYINEPTTLTTNPLDPDGLNGWFITEPSFYLYNPNSSRIYYEWDNLGVIYDYSQTGPFGFENAPNNQNITAGIVDLKYWGEMNCGENESVKSSIIKADFTDPQFTNLYPERGEVLVAGERPNISVLIDEVYQSNSGIKPDSIIFKLDNEIKNPLKIIKQQNVLLAYSPDTYLSEGIHEVKVYAKDYSGRDSSFSWEFEVINPEIFDLNVYSPKKGVFLDRRVQFNITTDKQVEKIEYLDWSDYRKYWRPLCRECDEVGYNQERFYSFREGEHNITIRATNGYGFIQEKNISLFIDTRQPLIRRTEPRQREYASGTFSVEFYEENPKELVLNINDSGTIDKYPLDLNNCHEQGSFTECVKNINISKYNQKEIEYWFELEDIVGNKDSSDKELVKVDSTAPTIDSIEKIQDRRYISFRLNITEDNFESAEYVDLNDEIARPRSVGIWKMVYVKEESI